MKLTSQHNQLKSSSANKGISLVEMIVVMSIIAVLAGISYPIIVNVIASSQQTRCLNNLKQIHSALVAYDLEHGSVPDLSRVLAASVDKDVFDTSHDFNCLRNQLERSGHIDKNSDLWICKSNKCGCNLATGSHYQVNNSPTSNPRYLFGEYLSGPKSLSDISNPEKTWIISDINAPNFGIRTEREDGLSNPNSFSSNSNPSSPALMPNSYSDPNYTGSIPASSSNLPTSFDSMSASQNPESFPPHRKGYNYLFADGSVKHIKY